MPGRSLMGRNMLVLLVLALNVFIASDLDAAGCDALAGQSIRWVVPSKPGGGYDNYSRLIQPFLEKRLKAHIVVENRPQAGGVAGAVAIRDARADGTTLGLINAAGLMAAHLISADNASRAAPEPSNDFTVLGRMVTNRMLLFTGRDSGIKDIYDVLEISAEKPVVVGVRDLSSASFFVLPIAARYLGLNYKLVTGYSGSSARVLAALRGEVDLILQTLDSVMSYVAAGELVPLLWISTPPDIDPLRALALEVPALDALDMSTAQSVTDSSSAPTDVTLESTSPSSILAAGRLIVAPVGLADAIESCLKLAVIEVLRSAELKRAAQLSGLSIEPADAKQAVQDLQAARRHMARLAPLVRNAIDEAMK